MATAKAATLLRHQARVVVVGPQATRQIRQQARQGKLVWRRRAFRARDVDGAFLAVAATDSAATNEAVFRACQARGVLCNVVDDPGHCDFFYPAVMRRGPLQVTISTDGRSPALAARLRREFERQFGPEWGPWVEHTGALRREILGRKLSAAKRRRQLASIASPQAFRKFVTQQRSRTASSQPRHRSN